MIQTRRAAAMLSQWLPRATFDIVAQSSPGDRDQAQDLRASPQDFFTRDLDQAIRDGSLDCAIHSAKDMPDPTPDGIDWCWLPCRQDPRDVIILRKNDALDDLPADVRIGVSSDRREIYAKKRFPNGALCPIRGNIEVRLAKLDRGEVDVLLMAGCALLRLGLEERITQWIPLDDLPTPEGQGALGITFRADDSRFLALRGLCTKAVTFAGAGAGSREQVTRAVQKALQSCDVCLHDALMDQRLLDDLPDHAQVLDVGKRSGQHRRSQDDITAQITRLARQGKRVVRLKGGDPGIFGRLAEETAALDTLRIPYRVLPGISSLQTATTATGMLLTSRDGAGGFTVMAARQKGGGIAPLTAEARADLPLVFFMSVKVIRDVADALIRDGRSPDCPTAVIFDAGGPREHTVRGTLETIGEQIEEADDGNPGLVVVGDPARHGFTTWGPLGGRRVLLTCSDALQPRAAQAVLDYGGTPLCFPLVQLAPGNDAAAVLEDVHTFDWLVITSPSAARQVQAVIETGCIDLRTMPKLLVAGTRTGDACRRFGLPADAVPKESAGTAAVADTAKAAIPAGSRVLRVRSDRAGTALTDQLRGLGLEVADRVLYRNENRSWDDIPPFDDIFFASKSSVESFLEQAEVQRLHRARVVAIGSPTATALRDAGVDVDVVPDAMTVDDAMDALARAAVQTALETDQ